MYMVSNFPVSRKNSETVLCLPDSWDHWYKLMSLLPLPSQEHKNQWQYLQLASISASEAQHLFPQTVENVAPPRLDSTYAESLISVDQKKRSCDPLQPEVSDLNIAPSSLAVRI